MLSTVNITPTVWPTAALIDWLNILKRMPAIPEQAKKLEDAQQQLRSRLTYAGTTLKFSNEDGDFWLMGRVDDVINVSGHRIGTAEVESALVSHPFVAEAAVVGMPHEIKGQGIYAFVTLKAGQAKADDLKKTLVAHVRKEIGPLATPDKIQFSPGLPKTRSGKIMRRILRKIAEDEYGALGDTSTLADPTVVDDLVDNRQNRKSA